MASFIANNGTRAGAAGASWGRCGQVGRASSLPGDRDRGPSRPRAWGPTPVAGLPPTQTHDPRSPGGPASWQPGPRAQASGHGHSTASWVSGPDGPERPGSARRLSSCVHGARLPATRVGAGRHEQIPHPTPSWFPALSPALSPCPAFCLQAALLSGTSATGPGVRTGAPVSAAGTRTCVSARSASAARTASKVRAGAVGAGCPSLPWHVLSQLICSY